MVILCAIIDCNLFQDRFWVYHTTSVDSTAFGNSRQL